MVASRCISAQDSAYPASAGMLLVEAFVEKLAANGMITRHMPEGRLKQLRETMAPLCCYVGAVRLEKVLLDAHRSA